MTRKYLITVALLGLWGIVMAVLGALVFNGKMEPENNSNFNLALGIHMIHVIALLSLTFMNRFVSRAYLDIIYYFFTAGVFLFSGALYIQSTEDLTNLIIGFVGYLVPLGGIALIGGWMMILITGVTYKHKKRAIHNQ